MRCAVMTGGMLGDVGGIFELRRSPLGGDSAPLGSPEKPLAPGRLLVGTGLRYARWDFQTRVLPIRVS